MQRHFDRDIEEIKDLLLRMGAMVEDTISQSIRALMERDTDLAEEVIARDDEIDRMEVEIDQKTIELIAKMQPAATDLRFVATIMKITPELERIADLAQDVCERVTELNREPQLKPMVDIPRLAHDAQRMVRQSLDAFVRGDANLARQVIAQDDNVDHLTEQSFRELLTYMLEDPRNISRAIRLTFIGKYFERMADGATNICEMVVYLVEGKVIKHGASLHGAE
ncbi:MAG: phosphate signaling complex protein PhoU [Acidobacteria bacterium]|nr:phosphate signaling complex protein PhoU [Acidobacteriota bacterium]MBV9475355.1 phosphate signaling complex protein PhoU [Acidobacteriota bacterium]